MKLGLQAKAMITILHGLGEQQPGGYCVGAPCEGLQL